MSDAEPNEEHEVKKEKGEPETDSPFPMPTVEEILGGDETGSDLKLGTEFETP